MAFYLEILAVQSEPFQIGVDENDRTMFSQNFTALAQAPIDTWEEDLATLLTSVGLIVLGTDTFIGQKAIMPDGEGPFCNILSQGGLEPLETHGGELYERLSAQIITRGRFEDARKRAIDIGRTLDGVRNTEVTATPPGLDPETVAGKLVYLDVATLPLSGSIQPWVDSDGRNATQTTPGSQFQSISGVLTGVSRIADLDGVDDFMTIPDFDEADGGQNLSWVFLINHTGASSQQFLWSKFGEEPSSWAIELNSEVNDELRVFVALSPTDSGGAFAETTTGILVPGNIYVVSVVYNGTLIAADRLKIYVDGVQQSIAIAATIASTMQATTHDITIGSFDSGSSLFFQGMLGHQWFGNVSLPDVDRQGIETFFMSFKP